MELFISQILGASMDRRSALISPNSSTSHRRDSLQAQERPVLAQWRGRGRGRGRNEYAPGINEFQVEIGQDRVSGQIRSNFEENQFQVQTGNVHEEIPRQLGLVGAFSYSGTDNRIVVDDGLNFNMDEGVQENVN